MADAIASTNPTDQVISTTPLQFGQTEHPQNWRFAFFPVLAMRKIMVLPQTGHCEIIVYISAVWLLVMSAFGQTGCGKSFAVTAPFDKVLFQCPDLLIKQKIRLMDQTDRRGSKQGYTFSQRFTCIASDPTDPSNIRFENWAGRYYGIANANSQPTQRMLFRFSM